eukprot:5317759-Amphidinium_carterae.1
MEVLLELRRTGVLIAHRENRCHAILALLADAHDSDDAALREHFAFSVADLGRYGVPWHGDHSPPDGGAHFPLFEVFFLVPARN